MALPTWSNSNERAYFPGDAQWNYWKQFYPEYERLGHPSANAAASSSSSIPVIIGPIGPLSLPSNQIGHSPANNLIGHNRHRLGFFRHRLLTHPVTRQRYSSAEMRSAVEYLKVEYKIRNHLNEESWKKYFRFVLETFSQDIKRRLMSLHPQEPSISTASSSSTLKQMSTEAEATEESSEVDFEQSTL